MLTKNANNDTDTMLTIGFLPIMEYMEVHVYALPERNLGNWIIS